MKLFGRNGKAREKWRGRARWIDLHKTRVTISDAPQVAERVQDRVQDSFWFKQTLLDALNPVTDDSVTLRIQKGATPDFRTQNAWTQHPASCEPARV